MKHTYKPVSLLFICIALSAMITFSFFKNHTVAQGPTQRGTIRMMFYNVENLFDTEDDPDKNDDDFLPDGPMHWTTGRYRQKLNNLYKVIVAVGGWQPPEIIGLCEIENRKVLEDITQNTPLSKYEYQIIHYDSPDERGIDVAMLYRKGKFQVMYDEVVHITFINDPNTKTRDVLYVKGIALKKDTLHIFINHWPSRRGGQHSTEKYRTQAARILRKKVDSIWQHNANANIILTGDFNDDPHDKSLTEMLKAMQPDAPYLPENLYNLTTIDTKNTTGTLKYKGNWNTFDQFIVSGNLLTHSHLHLSPGDFHIFTPDFLLVKDEKYAGHKPFRTYLGYRYSGGFSDHLPVYIDIWK